MSPCIKIASRLEPRAEKGPPPEPRALGGPNTGFRLAEDSGYVILDSDWLTNLKGFSVLESVWLTMYVDFSCSMLIGCRDFPSEISRNCHERLVPKITRLD